MKHLPALVVMIGALTMPQLVSASTIEIFRMSRADRSSSLVDHRYFEAGHWVDAVEATNDSGRGSASQDTFISPSFLGGIGFADAMVLPGTTGLVTSEAEFYVDFRVHQHYTFDVMVDLLASGGALSIATLSAWDGSFHWNANVRNGTTTLDREGVLVPGFYSFHLRSGASSINNQFGSPTGSASFSGGVTLAPIAGTEVPEPASLTLVGIGLLGAALRKRMSMS